MQDNKNNEYLNESEGLTLSAKDSNSRVNHFADTFDLVIPAEISIRKIMKQMNLWSDRVNKDETYGDSKICISGDFPSSTTEESVKSNESPKRSKRLKAKLLISSTPIATIKATKKDYERSNISLLEMSDISRDSSEGVLEKDPNYQTSPQRRYYNTKRKLRIARKKFEIDDHLAELQYQELVRTRDAKKKCLKSA